MKTKTPAKDQEVPDPEETAVQAILREVKAVQAKLPNKAAVPIQVRKAEVRAQDRDLEAEVQNLHREAEVPVPG